MYELADFIIGNLIAKDQYEIEYMEELGKLNIFVKPESMGKIIGKQGRIAKAIRTIFKAAAIKKDIRIVVDILEKVEEWNIIQLDK